ncbi:MAG TPA: SRPBCC family protein [Saprospiraceae bacterium]|nr:SRPBCC family protein [Saprospiraceae bacterium]
MRVKRKEWTQSVPKPLDEVWDFFSRPENLMKITPEGVFKSIQTDLEGVEMYEGMIIQYTIAPLFNIPMNWVTEITHIKDKTYFIDEQRFGPYAFWHHQHHFEAIEGGTRMRDILHYKVPIPVIGDLADLILVDQQVEQIFRYRDEVVADLFGTFPEDTAK